VVPVGAQYFINYRVDGDRGNAELLRERIERGIGHGAVFIDTTIRLGRTWPEEIRQALDDATVMLVIIGRSWLQAEDQYNRRRIDMEDDWVRLEIEHALAADKTVVPVLFEGAPKPPSNALPPSIAPLLDREWYEVRGSAMQHDIDLLLSMLSHDYRGVAVDATTYSLYPIPPEDVPDPLSDEKIAVALGGTLRSWSLSHTSTERGDSVAIAREYRFKTFRDAVKFMSTAAPGCDIANHHPDWENVWRTVRVRLTTWDIGHRVSDRDIQLAKYLDKVYAEFPGRLDEI
jgi:pterin-4a-carbinolamine dehydratase